MKNKLLLVCSIIIIMALILIIDFTNSRFYSAAASTTNIEFIKRIGKISIYHPEWTESGFYEKGEYFEIKELGLTYNHIRYKIGNYIDKNINENETTYYIRVVAEDGSNNIPIKYDVHENDNETAIFDFVEGLGYGPFTLKKDTIDENIYAIKAQWVSLEQRYLLGRQHLKVQMVTMKSDGSLLVIDEAPLEMEFTDKITSTVNYYHYREGLSSHPLLKKESIIFQKGSEVNFSSQEFLDSLGIVFPEGHNFYFLMTNVITDENGNWLRITDGKFKFSEDAISGITIEVYCVDPTKIMVFFNYFNENRVLLGEEYKQILEFSKGDTINFKDPTALANFGISLPVGYSYVYAESHDIYADWVQRNEFVLSNSLTQLAVNINVIVKSDNTNRIKTILEYYERTETGENRLESYSQQFDFPLGTTIDFNNATLLSNLGINLPEGYEFCTAKCNQLDSTGVGQSTLKLPNTATSTTYTINVILEKIAESSITVPIKFLNSSGAEVGSTTVNMKNDGTYDFTIDVCRTLCPNLSSMTSFAVYITNQWGSLGEIGNVANGTVTVDYNATYSLWNDFKLSDEGSYITIKAWW